MIEKHAQSTTNIIYWPNDEFRQHVLVGTHQKVILLNYIKCMDVVVWTLLSSQNLNNIVKFTVNGENILLCVPLISSRSLDFNDNLWSR